MPIVPEFNDEKRLILLKALFKKGALKLDAVYLGKKTSLKPTEVKKIIKELETSYGLGVYYPTFSSSRLGFRIDAWVFMQMDLSKKELLNNFMIFLETLPEVISAHRIIGSGKWNFAMRIVGKGLEEFDELLNQTIIAGLNGGQGLIIDKMFIFLKDPKFKAQSRAPIVLSSQLDGVVVQGKEKEALEKKLKVLNCIAGGECIKPNLRYLNRITGLHTSTIKASLDFLMGKGVIKRFTPSVRFDKEKAKFFVFDFFEIDWTDAKSVELLKEATVNDPDLFYAGSIFGDPHHNTLFIQSYDSVERYQTGFQEKYLSKSTLANFIKNRMTFFTISYHFEAKKDWPTRSSAMMKILIRDSGKQIN